MRLTVGPLPPSVYWRRRFIVLAGILVVLFLVTQACMAVSGSSRRAEGDPPTSPGVDASATATSAGDASPASTPEPEGATTPPPGGGGGAPVGRQPDDDRCTDEEIVVRAYTSRTELTSAELGAGPVVRFTIEIRNDSARTCVRDIGRGLRELYLIRGTGADRVWSSRGCDGPGADVSSDLRELPPGFATSYYIDWNGRSSSRCGADEQPAGEVVGPGEYQLYARLGTLRSEPVTVTVLP